MCLHDKVALHVSKVELRYPVVGTLFVNIGSIYCFVLPISMPKDIYNTYRSSV